MGRKVLRYKESPQLFWHLRPSSAWISSSPEGKKILFCEIHKCVLSHQEFLAVLLKVWQDSLTPLWLLHCLKRFSSYCCWCLPSKSWNRVEIRSGFATKSPHGGLDHGKREGSKNTTPGAPAFFSNCFRASYWDNFCRPNCFFQLTESPNSSFSLEHQSSIREKGGSWCEWVGWKDTEQWAEFSLESLEFALVWSLSVCTCRSVLFPYLPKDWGFRFWPEGFCFCFLTCRSLAAVLDWMHWYQAASEFVWMLATLASFWKSNIEKELLW